MASTDRFYRPELPLVESGGATLPLAPANTIQTEESVFRNGAWVEFWSRPNAGTHTPVANFTYSQSAPSTTTSTSTTGVTTTDGTQTTSTTGNTYTVTFDGLSSFEISGRIASWSWDFGDGSAAGSGSTVTHVYTSVQSVSVVLTVSDASGVTASITKTVTISGTPTSAPVANFTTSVSGYSIYFDGSASSSTNGATITTWQWAFGDGSTGSGTTITHTYAGGTYNATLTVTDSFGAKASGTITVQTSNAIPVPSFTATTNGLVLNVDGSGSIDPDGSIATYAWTYGDGGTATGVTPAAHTYASAGTYTVILTTTDNSGAQAAATKTITVTAAATDYIIGAAQASTTLVPASNSATMQDFVRCAETGEFYLSQVHPESDGTESVRLSRMTSAGALLDQMLLTDAGHGTVFATEVVNGVVFIWLNWRKATNGTTDAWDLVRFPYAAGTFARTEVSSLVVKVAGPSYRTVSFDKGGALAAVRTNGSGSDSYRRYPLANVLAGNLSGQTGVTITIPTGSSDPVMQGFATYYDSLFYYSGVRNDNVNYATDKPTITEYSWVTGAKVRTLDVSNFGSSFSLREPEGLSVYNTGTNPVLFFGMSTGPTGGPHTYPTWWYPLFNPDPVTTPVPPPPTGNTAKSPWLLGSPTEALPSGVQVVKWSDIATSSSDNSNPNVALARLTSNAVVDISGEQLTIPSFGLNSSYPTGLSARYFQGFIGGISNGAFDNQVTLRPNVMTSTQLSTIANQALWSTSTFAAVRPGGNLYGTGAASYFMGVHFVGADQGQITEAHTGWQYQTTPARYKGLDLDKSGSGSIFQNCLLQGFNAADGSSPPYEVGMVDMLRTSNFITRRVELDGQLPVGSPSRPTSTTTDPYGRNWKRSGGYQWNADKSPHMYNFSIHSGLVSGLTYSIASTSNNGSNNTADVYIDGLYVEDQSTKGFSGINFEDVLSSIYIKNPTIKMNGTGGYHLKFNPYLQSVAAPNIPSSKFQVIEPTWSGLGFNGMFAIGIAKWGSVQTSAPTVIKNGVSLIGTTSTTADPSRYYHIQAL